MTGAFGTEAFRLVRSDGTDTSYEAAHQIDTTRLESMVYEYIYSMGTRGCISDEVREAFPELAYSSITARYRALLDKNLIVDTGIRWPGKSGRKQRVMVATKHQASMLDHLTKGA